MANGGDLSSLDYDAMMSILDLNLSLFLLLLSFAIGLVVVFLVVKYIHKQTLRSLTTSRAKIDWSRFWFAFVFWGIISSGFILLDYVMTPEDYVYNFKDILTVQIYNVRCLQIVNAICFKYCYAVLSIATQS